MFSRPSIISVIGLLALSSAQAQTKWGQIQPQQVVLEKKEAIEGLKTLWKADQAAVITKGKSTFIIISPGGSIRKRLKVEPLQEKEGKSTRQTRKSVPSFLWLAADTFGTVESGNQQGALSLRLSTPFGDHYTGQVDMIVTKKAAPEICVGIKASAQFPHRKRGAWNAIDGDAGTEWVSLYPENFNQSPMVEIELDQPKILEGLSYLPRQGNLTNGQIYSYEIETRKRATAPWAQVATGKWDDSKSRKEALFPSPTLVQAIRLIGIKTKSNQNQSLTMSAAEITPKYAIPDRAAATAATAATHYKIQTISTIIPAAQVEQLAGKKLLVEIHNSGTCPIILSEVYLSQLPVEMEERKYKPRHSEFTDLNAIGLACRTCPSEKWPVTQVYSIEPGLAASRSGLKVGDLILKVQGQALKQPVLNVETYPLDEQWLETHHEPTIARATMKALRAGEHLQLEVMDPRTGESSTKVIELPTDQKARYQGFPLQGAAADELYAELIQRVLSEQKDDGSWKNMPANSGEMYGLLALLGTRDKQHLPAIHRAADYLLGLPEIGHESSYLELWSMAFKSIALGEYALATGDPRAIAWLDNTCRGLTQGGHINSRSYFTFGHDRRGLPYGGAGLIAPLSHIIVGDSLAARAGIQSSLWEYALPYNRSAWADNMPFGKQSIGYGAPSGGSDSDQAWCRSGLVALAASLRGTELDLQKGIAAYMRNHHGFMRRSHGYGGMGTYLGLMALAGIDAEAFQHVIQEWSPMIAMQWQKGKGLRHVEPQMTNIACVSGKASDDCYSYTMAALLSVRNKGLHCTGAKDTMWLPYPAHVSPPQPVLIHGPTGVNVARPSLLQYVKARYTTDSSAPTTESPLWKPEMPLEKATKLTVAYQSSNGKIGKPTTIRIDKENPAQWRVISASCGFPDTTVDLDVEEISIARASNAFDGNPNTAFRANYSAQNKDPQTWEITIDRQPKETPLPKITHITVPASKNERKNVNDSAKTIIIEWSNNALNWVRVGRGVIPESRVLQMPQPIDARYIRFSFESYSETMVIIPDLKFGYSDTP